MRHLHSFFAQCRWLCKWRHRGDIKNRPKNAAFRPVFIRILPLEGFHLSHKVSVAFSYFLLLLKRIWSALLAGGLPFCQLSYPRPQLAVIDLLHSMEYTPKQWNAKGKHALMKICIFIVAYWCNGNEAYFYSRSQTLIYLSQEMTRKSGNF